MIQLLSWFYCNGSGCSFMSHRTAWFCSSAVMTPISLCVTWGWVDCMYFNKQLACSVAILLHEFPSFFLLLFSLLKLLEDTFLYNYLPSAFSALSLERWQPNQLKMKQNSNEGNFLYAGKNKARKGWTSSAWSVFLSVMSERAFLPHSGWGGIEIWWAASVCVVMLSKEMLSPKRHAVLQEWTEFCNDRVQDEDTGGVHRTTCLSASLKRWTALTGVVCFILSHHIHLNWIKQTSWMLLLHYFGSRYVSLGLLHRMVV